MKKLLFAAAAALGLGYASLVGGPMDGTAWDVKVKPDALFSFSQRDTLIFQNGRLSVAGYVASGFAPAVYSAQPMDGTLETVWNASLAGAGQGIVSWQGLVRGDQIEGFAVWWTQSGKLKRFTFKGFRKTV